MSKKWHKAWNELVFSDMDKIDDGYQQMFDYVQGSTAIYKGEPVGFLYGAKWFEQKEIDDIKRKTELMYAILEKVIDKYKSTPSYRELFPFSKQLEELILIDHGYKNSLPIARIDFFYDEDKQSMKWCEFNADGTSAMNEDRELVNGLMKSWSYNLLTEGKECCSFELFETWIDAMINIYRDFSDGQNLSSVAIVDFLEKGSPSEFKIFKERMEKRGIRCEIADIRELKFEDGILFAGGNPVDVVYRRAVTSDMMDYYEEINDFIEMIKSQKVCLIGPLSTQIIHHKIIFSILRREETLEMLTDDEARFVLSSIPKTFVIDQLDQEMMNNIIHNKDLWIVKPFDRYGSKGVVAGVDVTEEEWENTFESIKGQDYIVQEFCEPFSHEYPVKINQQWEVHSFRNITGAFMYEGKFSGILSRTGPNGVISGINGGFSQPTIVIK